jgi:site-specific DNA-methyltransferase (adenine-specific)
VSEKVVIGGAELYHGDCLEILPTLPKVDAVVTDPPYGIDFTQRTTGAKIIGDDKAFDPAHLLGWPCFLWGANHYTHALPKSGSFHVWIKRAVEVASPKSYSDIEIAWCSETNNSKAIRLISDGCIRQGKEFGHVRVHPSQKPQEVMEWSLSFMPFSVVCDPYMGSGSTGIACVTGGRKFIGIEIERKYFDIACERIAAAYAQGRLFA